MPFTMKDNVALYWKKEGHGPALILGAGLGGVGGYWTPNMAALSAHFTVYRFDQRGTGKSERVSVDSIEQMSADLIAVMDDAQLDQAMYLGHSTGGAIGVATAFDYPSRLSSMMIYASTTCGDAYRRKVLTLRSKLLDGLGIGAYAQYSSLLLYPPYWINAHESEVERSEAATADQLGSADIQTSRFEAILSFDRRNEFSKITIPTMVVCADDDILTAKYFSEEFVRLIPGARFHWLACGGHAVSRTEPEIFNKLAVDFFKGDYS